MLRSTFRTVRGLPLGVQTLFVTTLIFRAGTMAFPFLAAYLIGSDGLSAGEVGAIVGAYGAGALLADLAAGPLLRLASARTVMLAGLISNGVLVAILPLLDGTFLLLAATVVWGFCYETFTPASYTTIVQNCDDSIRKVAFSAHRLAINLGMAIGPAVGGLIYVVQPTALFWVNAVVVFVAAAFLVTHRFESAPTTSEPPARSGRLVSSTWRGESRFWTFFVLSLPIHIAFALPPVFLSAYVIIERELSSSWVGAIFAFNAALIVLFEVPLNTAMRTMSHNASLVIGYVLTAVGFALMGLMGSGWGLLAATVVWSAAEMIVFPALMHYASDISEPEIVGRNMGLYSAGVNVGLIVVPSLALIWASSIGPGSPWLIAAAVTGVATVLIVAVHRVGALWLTPNWAGATK